MRSNTMPRHRRLIVRDAIACAALALSACGGGGDQPGVSPFACVQNGTCGNGSASSIGSVSLIGTGSTPPPACVPVTPPANTSQTTCASFCFQEDAQAYYFAFNAFQLDGNDQDGIACEQLKHKPAVGP